MFQQQIVRLIDAACGRIFDGKKAIVRLACFHRIKDVLEGVAGEGLHILAKVLDDGFFRIGPGFALERYGCHGILLQVVYVFSACFWKQKTRAGISPFHALVETSAYLVLPRQDLPRCAGWRRVAKVVIAKPITGKRKPTPFLAQVIGQIEAAGSLQTTGTQHMLLGTSIA